MEMGFIKGHSITAVLAAPMRDPVKYRILGYEVSLRRSEAQLIEVIPDEDAAAEGEATQAAAAMPDKGSADRQPQLRQDIAVQHRFRSPGTCRQLLRSDSRLKDRRIPA